MNYSKLNLTNFNTEPKKTKSKIKESKHLNCLVMNASNKRRINEKAFIRGRRLIIFLLVPAAFIRGRRLFEGGVYSSNYGMCVR